MSAVEYCTDGHREGFITIAALPALISPVAARMPADVIALAIRAYWMPMPSGFFKVVDRLFVGLKGLEEVKDVHGAPFCSMRYRTSILAFVKSKSEPFRFKKGAASHVNNVSLGKRGRHRSNVWTYPGASSLGSDARQGLQEHPTVKPTVMLQDALIDLSHRDDIILEPFGGSGSTLIACEKTGRVCCGIELDPLYVDVIIRRYQRVTEEEVILDETGETFDELEKRRMYEAGG
jgi:DNA methylase